MRTKPSVNTNSFEWKTYDSAIRFNEHNTSEIVFNLTDVVLLGTENSVKSFPENLNRLQVRKNTSMVRMDAFTECIESSSSCQYKDYLIVDFDKIYQETHEYFQNNEVDETLSLITYA